MNSYIFDYYNFVSIKIYIFKVSLKKHQFLVPLEWYEEVINKLTRITLLKCHNTEDLRTLSQILPKSSNFFFFFFLLKLCLIFFGTDNEYRRLIKLVHILKSNKISIPAENLIDIDDKSEQFNEVCFKVIEELLKIQKFNEAEDLAEFCELRKDRIHLARIGRQIELIRLNNDFEEILRFWKDSHIQLTKIGIKDIDFINFLQVNPIK